MSRRDGPLWSPCLVAIGGPLVRRDRTPGRRSRSSPGSLVRRQDLVGREVVVDDRVTYYVTRNGSEDDELQLKRTPITFLRPPPTAADDPLGGSSAAVVRGTLEREGSRLVCRVTGLELKPGDLERLKAAVDQLHGRGTTRTRPGLGAVGRAPCQPSSATSP